MGASRLSTSTTVNIQQYNRMHKNENALHNVVAAKRLYVVL